MRLRLAVLISGRGSNMEAILRASDDPSYPAEVVLVISDKEDAKGLVTARDRGIEAICVNRSGLGSNKEHEQAIGSVLDAARVDLIILAGYMRLLSAEFVQKFDRKILNIHPSLLPKHKGLNTHARAIDAGDRVHGCTVHFVNAEMDGGEILAQSELEIDPDDTPETLAKKVLALEHELYPSVIAQIGSKPACDD